MADFPVAPIHQTPIAQAFDINEAGGRVCLLPDNKFFAAIAYHPEKAALGFVLRLCPTGDAAIGSTGPFHYQNAYVRATEYFDDSLWCGFNRSSIQTYVYGEHHQRMTLCFLDPAEANLEKKITKLLTALNDEKAQNLRLQRLPKDFTKEFPQLPLLTNAEFVQVMATLELPTPTTFLERLGLTKNSLATPHTNRLSAQGGANDNEIKPPKKLERR
jgi:hypothetical protein